MIRIATCTLLTLTVASFAAPLAAQSPFQTTRHTGLPSILVGDKFASGDLDGDGDIDLFVANDNAPNQLLLNDGAGRFTDQTAGRFITQPGANASHSVDLADVDNDGDLDILIGNDDNLQNRLYLNDGFGFFADVTATALPVQLFWTDNQVVADFDGDGDVDWFTADTGSFHFLENDGTGVFTDASATWLAGMPTIYGHRYDVTPFARDIDGDFDLDVMVPRYSGSPFLILNQGGVLVPSPTQLPVVPNYIGHWFADYDGDGDVDIFAAAGRALLQNQGNGTFVNVTATAFTSQPSNGVACFDVDNDGDVDLATTTQLWRNNGNGTFTAQAAATALTWGFNLGVAAADFDGDGDIDLPGKPNFLRQAFAATAPVHGAAYSVEFHARPGVTSIVGACGALGGGVLPAGPFGTLSLDPTSAVPLAVLPVAGGPLTLSWMLPNVPALAGLELHYQACVIDPVEGPVISNKLRDTVQ